MFNVCLEAQKLGFSVAAVVEARSLAGKYEPIFEKRLATDYDHNLEYMRRNLDKRLDPRLLVEGARTIIVCGLSSSNLPFADSADARVASYGLCRDYHLIIKELLGELLALLKQAYPSASARCFVDTAPLLEKGWAVEANLGYIGRNSLLINRDFGTRLFLGEIVTDLVLEPTNFAPQNLSCNNCTACVDACPTGALKIEGGIDTRLCISRRTIEKQDAPYNNSDLHGWVFGCEVCQSVCPHNVDIHRPSQEFFQPLVSAAPTSQQWQAMSAEDFKADFKETPLFRPGLERIKGSL